MLKTMLENEENNEENQQNRKTEEIRIIAEESQDNVRSYSHNAEDIHIMLIE